MTLRREVAELLGYHAAVIDTNALTGQETWCLFDPDGAVCCGGEAYAASESALWEQYLPAYDQDLNLALELVPPWAPERVFMLRSCQDGWRASITDVEIRPEGGAFEALADMPAEAVCTAWTKWMDAAA